MLRFALRGAAALRPAAAAPAEVGALLDGPAAVLERGMATKRAGGSTRNGRDSHSKRLGVKKFGGEFVVPGNIIIRQRGFQHHPGPGVGAGKDHTLFALREGWVKFSRVRKYPNEPKTERKVVSIVDEPVPLPVDPALDVETVAKAISMLRSA
eukprot:tig00021428_g21145.t1